jgi:hypothetical protein
MTKILRRMQVDTYNEKRPPRLEVEHTARPLAACRLADPELHPTVQRRLKQALDGRNSTPHWLVCGAATFVIFGDFRL